MQEQSPNEVTLFEIIDMLSSLTKRELIQWYDAGISGYMCIEPQSSPPAVIYFGRSSADGYYFQRYQEGHESWIFIIGPEKGWVDETGLERKTYKEFYEACDKSSQAKLPVGDTKEKIRAVFDRLKNL